MAKNFDVYDDKGNKVLDAQPSPVTIKNLNPNTTYPGFQAAFAGDADKDNWVAVGNVVTKDVVPDAPSIAVTSGDGSVNYVITPGTNQGSTINSYTIYYTDGTTEKPLPVQLTLTGTVKTLTNGTKYSFAVTATNNAGESARSAVVNAVPAAAGTVPATGLAFGGADTTVTMGTPKQVVATVTPDNAADKKVNYTVSDTTIATVAADGTVTGVKAGDVTLTGALDSDPSKTATVTVHIIAAS